MLRSVSTIIIQCTVSLQKPVESLPMFYRVEKKKKLLINCKLFDRIFYKHVFGMYAVKIIRIALKHQFLSWQCQKILTAITLHRFTYEYNKVKFIPH